MFVYKRCVSVVLVAVCSWPLQLESVSSIAVGPLFGTLQQPPYKDSLKSGLGILSFQKSLGYRLYNPSTLEAQVEQTLDMTTHL